MPKLEKVKAGDVLYDVRRDRWIGWAHWIVRVISVDIEAGTAVVSWNSNKPRIYGRKSIEKLRWTPKKKESAR